MDVAPWGERASWEGGRDVGVWWEDPRDIHRVVVTFAETPPAPESVKLQWWQSQWPEHCIPRDQPAGAGESGWGHLGDLYQGRWRDADAYLQADGRTWTYTFRHLNATEFPALKDFGPEYRTTLKLRLLGERPLPKVERFETYTDSVWHLAELGITGGTEALNRALGAARLEVFNGYAERLGPAHAAAREAGLRVRVVFTESPHVNSFDSTVVTVRLPEGGFSFDPAAVAAGRHVLAPEPGCLVKRAEDPTSFAQALAAARAHPDRPVYERVFAEPEQSLARALAEQPPKPGRIYLPLGTEGGRQRFGVNPDGSVFCVADRIDHPRGRDSDRLHWGGHRLDYDFDLPRQGLVRRGIEDDSLPIIHTEWERDGIRYTQTTFVTRLEPGSLGFPDMQADDPVVLVVKIHGRNLAPEYRTAHATLALRADGRPLPLTLRGDLLFARVGDTERLRAAVEVQGAVQGTADNGKVRFAGHMPPGTDGYMILRIPFITLDRPEEIERLRDLDFDAEFRRVKSFWQARADAATRIVTPVSELNHFYRALTSHLLINCGREPGADRLGARVGSFSYGVFGNESCMMITELDRRGLHDVARRCLDMFLHYQGTVKLPGDYATQDGIFNGAAG